jgi:ubiquinone/menaquinone biosynthesis C-methylase UbiE
MTAAYSHTPMTTTDLTLLRRLVERRHVDLADSDVLDVGCGNGGLVRELTALGARVTGMEISELQLAAARAADDGAGARYIVGRAESIPLADGSFDLVVFRASLHHVPIEQMLTALREARRVLRRGGHVYAAEPLARGDFYELVSIVDNEDEVRDAAQRTLANALAAGLAQVATEEYELEALVGDLDTLRRRMVAVDPGRAAVFDAHRDELNRRFAELGEPAGDGRRFTEIMRAVVLRTQ